MMLRTFYDGEDEIEAVRSDAKIGEAGNDNDHQMREVDSCDKMLTECPTEMKKLKMWKEKVIST